MRPEKMKVKHLQSIAMPKNWDPGSGTLTWDLSPEIRSPGPYMWEPGPNTYLHVERGTHYIRKPYINTTFSYFAVQQRSLVVSNRQLHKFVEHDRRIDYVNTNIIVFLSFWLFQYIYKNHKLAQVWTTQLLFVFFFHSNYEKTNVKFFFNSFRYQVC